MPDMDIVMRLPPNYYIHVLDQNTNISRVEIGPQTFIKQGHETIIQSAPTAMVSIPPLHYCVIRSPVMRKSASEAGDESAAPVIFDKYGQAKLRHGDIEYRFEQDPFPLYPGEIVSKKPTRLLTLRSNEALRLKAITDFTDTDSVARNAADEWYFKGPAVYKPRKEVEEVATVKTENIRKNEALRVAAIQDCIDNKGTKRFAGEEWLIRDHGDYLLGIDERIVDIVKGVTLYDWKAICLEAIVSHEDQFGIKRKAGDQWLVTNKESDCYIPDTSQKLVGEVEATRLTQREYCIISDPADEKTGLNIIGTRKVIRGPTTFFILPGEKMLGDVSPVYQLSENEGLILQCVDEMEGRTVGEKWLLRGPCEYVPPVTVEVIKERKAIALDENEGVYVRNTSTGKIRSVISGNYMLNQDEELWNKKLSEEVSELLNKDALAKRSVNVPPPSTDRKSKGSDVTRIAEYEVVRYRLPHNSAARVYDYRAKKSRVVFGPDLIILGPDEEFTLLSLSGATPKKPNVIKAICMLLGPDYFVDVFVIETSDHARLSLRLSMNWTFEIADLPAVEQEKIFDVPDFIGDTCKNVAARIRGSVSSIPFDEFHKHSAKIIKRAVFGVDVEKDEPHSKLVFNANHLAITGIDIISLEPVDQKTRDALQRTVQLAIEITTNSQEAAAKQDAQRLKQEAEGKQERQKIQDEIEAEGKRRQLLELKAESASIEACGQSVAEAKGQAEAAKVEMEKAVELAKLREEAEDIKANAEYNRLKQAREAELDYLVRKNEIELERQTKEIEIEIQKFKNQIESIGKETIVSIASAGPETKIKMLQALGLKSALITDGVNPINLFDTAGGLIDFMPSRKDANHS